MTKQRIRHIRKEKEYAEDTLFLFGVFFLLLVIGHICYLHGWVIFLD